jgi:hypothetical protein
MKRKQSARKKTAPAYFGEVSEKLRTILMEGTPLERRAIVRYIRFLYSTRPGGDGSTKGWGPNATRLPKVEASGQAEARGAPKRGRVRRAGA